MGGGADTSGASINEGAHSEVGHPTRKKEQDEGVECKVDGCEENFDDGDEDGDGDEGDE